MTDPVRFWWRGRLVTVDDVPASTSVLEWLRVHAGATGTKEGCDEGDCGACTVVVGDREPDALHGRGRLRLTTANACLMLLPMLHGRALFTVEDVADGGALHPVQRALVERSGSQCGYCTPGIVMSLWCEFERARDAGPPTRDALSDRLAGNLCRCTGYRSVLDAAEAAMGASDAGRPPPHAVIEAALAQVPLDRPLEYRAAGTSFLAPTSVSGILDALAADPSAVLVAGGTDLVLAARLAGESLPPLVWTGRAPELSAIDRDDAHLRIGGATSLERAWAALAAEAPALAPWWRRFAGPAIRAAGTMGGNVANGSPIADGTPVLLALDADVVLADTSGERRVPVERFHVGRRETLLRPGELLVRVDVPLSSFGRDLCAFKVSRRHDSDISTVSAVLGLALDGDRVQEVRIVLGGMAATVRRAHAAEAAVLGRPWTRETLAAAQAALDSDVTPMSDHRGSAAHRLRTARALLERWWWQTRPDAPLPADRTEVWSLR